MKIVKNITSILLTFVIMIGVLSSTILNIVNNYTNKEYLISKLEEIEIYKQIYEEVQNGFEEYIYQSGLEINTLKNICDEEKIKNDFLAIIDGMYEESEVVIDTSSIKENLDAEITQYVKSQGRKLTTDEEKNIEEFENLIVNSYENSISVYTNIKDTVNSRLKNIIDKCLMLRNLSIIVMIVLSIVLIGINIKKIFSGIGYIGSAFLSSGIILLIAQNIIYKKIDIDNLLILTKAMSNSIIYIIKEMLNSIKYFGNWYIAIGVFIIIMTSILSLDTKKEIESRPSKEN